MPKSQLAARLQAGEFAVTAEVIPPISADPTGFIQKALTLKDVAAAVNVTDGAGASSHLSALAASKFMIDVGVEPVLQMTCRDRNRLAIQSDMIAAAAFGVHNLLMLTGDDPTAGEQPDTKGVFDLNSDGLVTTAKMMSEEKKLPTGKEIGGEIDFFIGGADMPTDPTPDWEPKGLKRKIAAGARFVQTQFCMDIDVVRRYAARLVDLGVAQQIHILIGVCPIPSARSARWMKEKLFGVVMPDWIAEKLDTAEDPKAEGRAICAELMRQLAEVPGIAGCHVMAPASFSAIPEVVKSSGVFGKQRAKIA